VLEQALAELGRLVGSAEAHRLAADPTLRPQW
jgi:hypothetical protein